MSDLISRQDAKSKKVYSHERHEYVVPVAELDWLPSAQPETHEERTETHACDCISRQAAIDAINHICPVDTEYDCALLDRVDVRYVLSNLPSAQPERMKGKWIYHPEIGWGETWLCDQCGEKTTSTVMGKPRANFCPNCGARMDAETRNNTEEKLQ